MRLHPESLKCVIQGIERSFERFPALRATEAPIAFSGGKDSIALAYALAAMGRSTHLRAIDMGYSDRWRGRICELASALALPIEIIKVSSLIEEGQLAEEVREDLTSRRAFLNSPAIHSTTVTPCTNCYNCKIISLVHRSSSASPTLFFAHHSTDVLASFLKSALMFYDRWADGNASFDKPRFRNLGLNIASEIRAGKSRCVDLFERYLKEGIAQTSEPPLERRILHGRAYAIGRPLFFVDERATAALTASIPVNAESSGCGHSATSSTRTPREIVHYELIPLMEETQEGRNSLDRIGELIAGSLKADGTVEVDVRGSRDSILGTSYKGGPDQFADRL